MDFAKRSGRRRALGWALSFLALLALWAGKDCQAMEENKLIFATDMHYLSEKLTDHGPVFDELMRKGDGKLTEYGRECMAALFGAAREEGASVVVLAGDLTFNGEMDSLLDLREMLREAEKTGLRFLVIPGNHDIAYPYACCYFGSVARRVQPVSQEEFAGLMGEFGYEDALYRDEASFSYVYPLDAQTWLLFLDANTEAAPGRIRGETLEWMKKVLSLSGNARVIAVCHQNILPHSTFMQSGFVLGNRQEVAQVLREAGVTLALSGHSHLQHTAQEDGLVDICTESLAVAPLRYALLSWRTGEAGESEAGREEGAEGAWYRYEKKALPIRQSEARERFYLVVGRQVAKVLEGKKLTAGERQSLISFAQEVNLAYFSGDITPEAARSLQAGLRWRLWKQKASDTFWYLYMNSYLKP